MCDAIISLEMGWLPYSELGNKLVANTFLEILAFYLLPTVYIIDRSNNNEVVGKHQVIYLHLRKRVSYRAIIWWKYRTRLIKNVDHTQYTCKWVLWRTVTKQTAWTNTFIMKTFILSLQWMTNKSVSWLWLL